MNDEKRPEGEADKLYEQTIKNLLKAPPERKRDERSGGANRTSPGKRKK